MKGRIKRQAESRPMRVPIIGKVKIGEKVKKNGKEYPRSLDYFKPDGKYAKHFTDTFGPKPSTIEVVFISDNVADVCEERYEIRDGQGRLFGKGDGETFQIWNQEQERYAIYDAEKHPDIMARIAQHVRSSWYVTLELRFLIPKIRGVIGQWQFRTKGDASSIPSIRDAFDFVQERAGTVINVPFDLHVEKVTSQKPGSKSVFPVVNLVPNVSTEHLEMVAGFLESGHDVREIRGMLTEEAIERHVPKQLGSGRTDDVGRYETEVDWGDPSKLTDEEREEYEKEGQLTLD